MIDTNELRARANATENKFPYLQGIALAASDELDRLYELERRNTPLTREEIEAELVRRGFVLICEIGKQSEYQVLSGNECITVLNAHIWNDDGVSIDVAGKKGMKEMLQSGATKQDVMSRFNITRGYLNSILARNAREMG